MCEPFKPVTREEAAEILSVSLTTLDELIKAGIFPPPRSIGAQRRKYWHPDVFYSCLDRALTTDEPEAPCDAHSRAEPPAPASSHRSASRVRVSPAEQVTPHEPARNRTRGRPDVRARQAARLRELNQ